MQCEPSNVFEVRGLAGSYLPLVAFIPGTAFGSLAGVAIQRVPAGRSLMPGRSMCPACGVPVSRRDSIPLLSYILLKGRCRHCRQRISLRYPLVELATGLIWVALSARIGLRPELPAFLAFGTALVILSAIDLEHRRLPNRVLVPASVLAVVLLGSAAIGEGTPRALLNAALGALGYGLPMLLIGLIVPAGMGGGDVKFAPYLGLHLGWLGLSNVAVGAFLGFLLGALVGVVLMAVGKAGRKDPIAFGPFMALGALLTVLQGEQILRVWLG